MVTNLKSLLRSFSRLSILAVALCLSTACALSQATETPSTDNPPSKRPTVGLVLEGGGALGLAHIGVLQYLEEHRIPVNYVAGTSMGGLVGGIYSTGRSAGEVRKFVESIPWDDVLRGVTPFEKLTYRRKEDAVQFPSTLEFGLRRGLQLPSGFNSGQGVFLLLDPVTLPYSEVKSFDDLPIPYACVATDLTTNSPYVFRSGSLSRAMRSTMSLPGIFTPVYEGNHVFADGGLLDNLPVDVASQMGAEFIVAIHLQSKQLDPNEPLSSFGVLGASIATMIAANENRSKPLANLLINVDLVKYDSLDYAGAENIIKAGYDAAQKNGDQLAKLSVDDAAWRQYIAQRNSRRREAPVPTFIEVEGTSPGNAEGIKNELTVDMGKPLDQAKLQNQLLDLAGNGRYAALSYEMINKNGQQGLLIQASEKSYAPPIVRPLVVIDGSQYNNVLFTMGSRFTFLDFGAYGSEWRIDVLAGSTYALNSEYFHPVRPGSHVFVAPRMILQSVVFNVYDDKNNVVAEYRQKQIGGGADVGYQFGRSAEVRVGYQSTYFKYKLQVGNQASAPNVSGRQGFTRIQFTLLHANDPVIPTKGQIGDFRTQYFDANPGGYSTFTLSQGTFDDFIPISKVSTIFAGTSMGTTYGNNAIGVPAFGLGGVRAFAAYGTNEILTNEYYQLQVGYLRQLARLPPLLGDRLFFETKIEGGQYNDAKDVRRTPFDGAVGFVVNTIFGPVEIGAAAGDRGNYRVFFGVGKNF